MVRMTTTKMGQPRAGSPVVADIIAQLRGAFRELRCMSSQRMHQAGLSIGHFHLTSMLELHGALPMSRIADLLDVSMPAATGIIDRLEERGLAERVRVPSDRRVVLVQLTYAGRQALQDVEVFKDAMLETVLSRLSPARLEALNGVIGDLRTIVADLIESEPELFGHHHPQPHATRN
jgi:DNA-binding MarR family transcriptional regulator